MKRRKGDRGSLERRLAGYDGKKTELLETIVAEIQSDLKSGLHSDRKGPLAPGPEVQGELLALVASRASSTAIGATWLLKALLEEGLELEPTQIAQLARCLDRLTDDWARLHICQSMRFLSVPGRNARPFARFLETASQSQQKFLRAWAMDGLWRLANQHERFLPRAIELVELGSHDAAPSVRARARKIRKEMSRG